MASVHLTERALRDLDEIDSYSISTWGERIATRYLDDINAALQRLGESPALLQERSERSLRVRFYPVREHVLVCDVFGDDVYILAVWHGAMDLAGWIRQSKTDPFGTRKLTHLDVCPPPSGLLVSP